jgi:endogenous inhibitor of DNA gyrase (YacG/DUF329 family)
MTNLIPNESFFHSLVRFIVKSVIIIVQYSGFKKQVIIFVTSFSLELSNMRYICPICRKPVKKAGENGKFFPFCSKRCSLIDLGAWLDADYKLISEINDHPAEEQKTGK